jgi:hypothetical protein
MLVTGFVLRSPDWTRELLSARPAPTSAAARPAAPAATPAAPAANAAQPVTLGQALTAAAAALPQARPIRLYPAISGTIRVRMRGEEWHPIGLNNVFVSTQDASVRRIVRAEEQPLSVRYLNVVYSLHIGAVPASAGPAAALAVRALWTLIALSLVTLAVSGAVQRFRSRAKAAAPMRPIALEQRQAQ